MTEHRGLVVIGAGPAGMHAALCAASNGVDVVVLDERAAPGGQVYRNVETPSVGDAALLGDDYARGAALVAAFRDGGIDYRPNTFVWEVTPERTVRVSGGVGARTLSANRIVIATGALERPFPIPGWTLPGVLAAGGAQVLLKSAGMVPSEPAVLAGTGPLLFLLASQYLRLGVRVAAVLETTPREQRWRALPHLPAAFYAGGYLRKGMSMLRALRGAAVRHVRGVEGLRAVGTDRVERVEYRVQGRTAHIDTGLLLLHQGVVPDVNLARAIGCQYDWDAGQLCFRPRLDDWWNTDVEGVAVVGDGAGIDGALSAECAGELAGLEATHRIGHIDRTARDERGREPRANYRRSVRVRPFLQTLYRPPDTNRIPVDDDVVACRCEEVSAGTVRREIARAALDPNAIKSRTRCGMGPCQGRYCGLTLTEMVAAATGASPQSVGYFRLRPPAKPVPLADILALETGETPAEMALPDPHAHVGASP